MLDLSHNTVILYNVKYSLKHTHTYAHACIAPYTSPIHSYTHSQLRACLSSDNGMEICRCCCVASVIFVPFSTQIVHVCVCVTHSRRNIKDKLRNAMINYFTFTQESNINFKLVVLYGIGLLLLLLLMLCQQVQHCKYCEMIAFLARA